MLWVLAFHIIFVITWFAGLFYLPRLFVYHAQTTDTISLERFKIMERRLFYGIMLPSAILVFISGALLLINYGWGRLASTHWLQLKLLLVLVLYLYFAISWKYMLDFKQDRNQHTPIFYRLFNEVPSVILIVVIVLAIVKPF